MSRQFYSLPDPRRVKLNWREFEKARDLLARIEQRLQAAQNKRAKVEEQIRLLGDAEISELARAILKGEDDPTARHDEHEKLVAELRELKREEQALSQALPKAAEELRLTVYENQQRWKDDADRALEKAIADERQAYDRALNLIQEPRSKRIYAELLSQWVRNVGPAFGEPHDVAALSAIQNLSQGPYYAEEKLQERRYNEQLQAQQQEGVA